ncbi:MAG: sensor histidine kinase [Clostridiales bacterium]|nr:sensor histidine kinase [Clostridiales bacterium]
MNYIKEKLRQLGEYFNHKGIQFVIAASFTLVAILGMGFIGVFLYQGYGSAAEDMVLSNSKQVIDQVEINLNTYLRNMMRISDAVYYNVIKNTDLDEESMSQEMNLLYEVYRDNLVGLACFTDTGELISSVPMGNLKENVDVTKQSWFVDAQDKMENLHFSDLHVQNIFENSTNRYYWVISLSRGVELTNSGKMSEGILLVDMDFSGIRQLFAKVNSQNMGYVYLMDSDGKIIYHPRQNLIFSNMIQENNEMAKTYEDGAHRETFEGEDRMVAVKTVGYTGWKIVSVMPMEKFLGDFSRTRTMAVMIIIVAILVMIFANQFVAVRVAKPLRNLEDSLTGIGMDRKPQIYIGGPPEIQHLGETIRSMVEQLRQLTDDIVREQEEKRKSELDALQSQINPHFLYNTLDSIMWMIEAEKYDDAISMVQALSRLFRISLSKGKNIITVGEELQHAKNYLDIQKYRYKNKFTSYFEIEQGIEKYKTIKLIIQPLIENAIYYGMEYMDGDGEIYVRAYTKEEDLFIEVEDNGLGMQKAQVESLLTDGTRIRSKGSGIGIRNVHQRIQLYFGTEYGLEILSEPDEGTMVRIHLPKTENVDEKKKEEQ